MNNKNLTTEKEINDNIKLTIFEKLEAKLELKKLNKSSKEYKGEKDFIEWLKEMPKRVKEWEKNKIVKKITKPIIKDDINNNKSGSSNNRKGKLSKSIFDPYKDEIISLLKEELSLERILKVIKVGHYSGFHYYVKTRKLKKEAERALFEIK